MLTIRNLVKIYPGPVNALQGITLDVAPGMFGLLGPNGAGKSTLMKILAGLLEPTAGQVFLDGENITERPELVRSRLGYLPQDFGFYGNLTGERMLAYLLRLKGVSAPGGEKRLVGELLGRVNLAWAGKRKVKTYSGGMRQRLGIAQALAGNPRLIVVDEPTAGLDPEERLRFYTLLAELAADRIVVLSTHIVEDVRVLCPRFAVIREGRLVELTSPSAALATIAGRIWEGRVAPAEVAEVAQRFALTQAVLYEGSHRVRIYLPAGPEQPPLGFEQVPASLEDAYILLMRGNGAAVEAGRESETEPVGAGSPP